MVLIAKCFLEKCALEINHTDNKYKRIEEIQNIDRYRPWFALDWPHLGQDFRQKLFLSNIQTAGPLISSPQR